MAIKEDLTGQIFGDFEVIKFDDSKGKYKYYWLCKCTKCGKEKSITTYNLLHNKCTKCRCQKDKEYKGERLDGKRFGRWTVIKLKEKINIIKDNKIVGYKIIYLCKCDCGTIKEVDRNSLVYGKSTSCGCYNKERIYQINKKYNKYDLSNEYGIGWTSNTNEEFYFDLEDYDKIKDYCWYSEQRNKYLVNKSNNNNKTIRMHRLIMNVDNENNKNILIDHINHNTLDNRKANLRIVNKSKNEMNKGLRSNNKSGYTGVYYDKKIKKWVAKITINGNNLSEYFEDKKDAINKRQEYENLYFKEYSFKNSMNDKGETNKQ